MFFSWLHRLSVQAQAGGRHGESRKLFFFFSNIIIGVQKFVFESFFTAVSHIELPRCYFTCHCQENVMSYLDNAQPCSLLPVLLEVCAEAWPHQSRVGRGRVGRWCFPRAVEAFTIIYHILPFMQAQPPKQLFPKMCEQHARGSAEAQQHEKSFFFCACLPALPPSFLLLLLPSPPPSSFSQEEKALRVVCWMLPAFQMRGREVPGRECQRRRGEKCLGV